MEDFKATEHTLQQAPDHVDPCTLCDIRNDAGMCKDPDSMGRECDWAGYWKARTDEKN